MVPVNCPAISETAIRLDFNIDKLIAKGIKSVCRYGTIITHLGRKWEVSMMNNHKALHLYLTPTTRWTETTPIVYGLRFINGDLVHTVAPESVTPIVNYNFGVHCNIMPMNELVTKFCVKRIFTIEFFFPFSVDDRIVLPIERNITLATAVFKEISITCHGVDVAMCNKCVIGRESKMALGAFSNEDSVESRTKSFAIDHEIATPETSLMLIRLMYEEWDSKMDEHARDLLVLADYMDCERISAIVINQLDRLLTPDTFWPTCDTAVLLKHSQPALFDLCTRYASVIGERMNELLNHPTTEERKAATIAEIVTAVAARFAE